MAQGLPRFAGIGKRLRCCASSRGFRYTPHARAVSTVLAAVLAQHGALTGQEAATNP